MVYTGKSRHCVIWTLSISVIVGCAHWKDRILRSAAPKAPSRPPESGAALLSLQSRSLFSSALLAVVWLMYATFRCRQRACLPIGPPSGYLCEQPGCVCWMVCNYPGASLGQCSRVPLQVYTAPPTNEPFSLGVRGAAERLGTHTLLKESRFKV